jgi:hypothetical protein
MKQSSLKYIESTKNLDSFKEILFTVFPNINLDNAEFIDELYKDISLIDIKGHVHFNNECAKFFKNRRNGKGASKLSKDYWVSLGWDLSVATNKALILQDGRSHLTIKYWLNKGFTESVARDKIKGIQSRNSNKRYEKYTKEEISSQSVWSKSYWLNKGLCEADAIYEVSKHNYAHRNFWETDDEYAEIKKIIGKKTSTFIKENPEVYASFFGSISKEEILFFDMLCEHNTNINHKQFIVNVKKSIELNQGIVKYDGYIKTSAGIILIEYDGLYWHNQSYDEIKDRITLAIRTDILGIIRVSCKHFKDNNKQTIKKINNAIEQIKNKEGNRIKIY